MLFSPYKTSLFQNALSSTLMLLISFYATHAKGWDEQQGTGSINGFDFPIAVIRNAGSEATFLATLKARFGSHYDIITIPGPFGYGQQFIVKPFTENQLLHLPIDIRADAKALEQFVFDHTMTFSLLNINEESLAIGTPVSTFLKAVPGPAPKDGPFGHLHAIADDCISLIFRFGNVEVTSLSGKLTVPTREGTLALRSSFEQQGLSNPAANQDRRNELQTIGRAADRNGTISEFFTNGKDRAANFTISKDQHSNEVLLNANQVQVR